ncbi:MAG: hypothetical protein IJO11_07865 [Alphaproteobacteria bacterium]|nr:hypothetical protein [Alphaproteobacteria bacterium]
MRKIIFLLGIILLPTIAVASSTECQRKAMHQCMNTYRTAHEAKRFYMNHGEYCAMVAIESCNPGTF